MKRHLRLLLAFAMLSPVAAADRRPDAISRPGAIAPGERALFRFQSDPRLGSMRAGRDQDARPVRDSERTALKSAESRAPELGEMRGGLDTVEVLLIVVLVLVILILI
jgi:hypothetical protein